MNDTSDWDRTVAAISVGLALVIFVSHPALAQGTGSSAFQPVDTALTMVVNALQGTIARSIAIIAIAFLGFAAMFGRITWFLAGSIIIGIALVFGAGTIVDALKTT